MLLLALDTSTPRVAVALVEVAVDAPHRVRGARLGAQPQRHGEQVAPTVRATLAAAGAGPGDVGAVAVGVGPGPFTGLRVGIMTAAALADGWEVPAYAVCSLDAVAAGCPGEPVVAVSDARRREVYWATYDEAGRRRHGPAVDRPETLPGHRALSGVTRLAGPGAHLVALPGVAVCALEAVPAEQVAALAAPRALAGAAGDALTPLYLRRPDAVASAARKPVTA